MVRNPGQCEPGIGRQRDVKSDESCGGKLRLQRADAVDQVFQLSNRLCPDVGCGRTARMSDPVRNGIAEIVRHCGNGCCLLTRRQVAEVEPVVRM